MTAMTATSLHTADRRELHGIDRLVMAASLAGLRWARRHADRTAVEPAERFRLEQERRQREHDAALRIARAR